MLEKPVNAHLGKRFILFSTNLNYTGRRLCECGNCTLPTAQPCLIVIGGLSSIQNALLVVEKKAVTNFPPNQALVILLGAFYAYNMHYPEGCKNIYTFFEVVFFKYKRPAKKTRLAAILAKLTYC